MTMPRGQFRGRSGFTLIELLTVIGIISMLIAIAVPSLVRARDVARKTTTLGELDSIGKDLEMLENDLKAYPESSSTRIDPVIGGGVGLPSMSDAAPWGARMMGAHWLARALVGPDLQGVDQAGEFLKSRVGAGFDATQIRAATRKGSYFENNKLVVRDTDSKFGTKNQPATGRWVIIDSFGWPVLYYKANSRAQQPFSNTAVTTDALGVYDQRDNIAFTGGATDALAGSDNKGWDFAATGAAHGLGFFGPTQANLAAAPDTVETLTFPAGAPLYKGKSFANYLHEHKTHEAAGVIKAVRPETFILISAGKDGLYGTEDDVNNFAQ